MCGKSNASEKYYTHFFQNSIFHKIEAKNWKLYKYSVATCEKFLFEISRKNKLFKTRGVENYSPE